MEKSIAEAKKINPDKVTNPCQTLDEYIKFLDASVTRMPWKILEENFYKDHQDADLAFRTDQSIIYPFGF